MKTKVILLLAIAITTALLVQPMRAKAIDTLVITETSSTSLTAILNTSTSLNVTNGVNADSWFIALAGVSGPASGSDSQQFWIEPDAASAVNIVQTETASNGLNVLSDVPAGGVGIPNGTTDTKNFSLNGHVLKVTFFDQGDVAPVPDTGSTLGLLSMSVVALLGAFLSTSCLTRRSSATAPGMDARPKLSETACQSVIVRRVCES